MTFKPCHAAVTAADKPAAPEPTINTSQSTSGRQVRQASTALQLERFLEFGSRKYPVQLA
jgi:hypothetical protein